jgi:hypothetical protein
MIARSRPRTADIRRDRRAELQEPPPDRLVGCVNASLGQQFLHIPKGQREPGIEPDRVADDFWREPVALKRYRSHRMMLIGDEPQSYPSYRDIAPQPPRHLQTEPFCSPSRVASAGGLNASDQYHLQARSGLSDNALASRENPVHSRQTSSTDAVFGTHRERS